MGYDLFSFEIVGKKYKINYLGLDPMYVMLSVKLKGIGVSVQSIRHEFGEGSWFIPELDYTGCSILELRDFNTNEVIINKVINPIINGRVKNQNIVCIGLNKTGTTSFSSSLSKLGYNKFDEAMSFQTCSQDVYHGDYNRMFSVLENERYNLYDDMPFSYPRMYERLYERRPDDIYVLTIRDNVDKWVKSVINFYPLLVNNNLMEMQDKSYMYYEYCSGEVIKMGNQESVLFNSWGINDTSNLENKLTSVYLNHNSDAINFFNGKKSNFMVVNVSVENELSRFCNWLGIKSDINNFDWVNKRL